MRFASFFFDRASRAFGDRPTLAKLVFIIAGASSGGLIAYADAKTDLGVSSYQRPSKKKVVVLGTGWGGTSFLRNLDSSLYDVQVISPRNYFTFTPLLPSVTSGTVEARSIVEPIRNIIRKKGGEIKFWEAECFKIDPSNKRVHCRYTSAKHTGETDEFLVEYDYLVIAIGAKANTFNIPGVEDNCHFLKEIEDAQKIRKSIMDCFERATLPNLNEDERKKILHFVIVGGGPTGVEFAAELHDFVCEDLSKLYPSIYGLVKIAVIQGGEHILTAFDERISTFAEEKFKRDGIDLKIGFRVVKVSDEDITMMSKATGEFSVPYGMVVWSAGIGTRLVISDFMKQIGQGNRLVLATDEWLRVSGCDGVYAVGDCASIIQRKVMLYCDAGPGPASYCLATSCLLKRFLTCATVAASVSSDNAVGRTHDESNDVSKVGGAVMNNNNNKSIGKATADRTSVGRKAVAVSDKSGPRWGCITTTGDGGRAIIAKSGGMSVAGTDDDCPKRGSGGSD
ncbi:hypothetical protein KSP40_PGU019541 [Platanthera guangdongensis]|uniref:NADH:ubiquinone reductase (non-electrogenic) n=1 Tax=Platanthera guangdongensis TaxID=2320717 RepID=A0ABR2N3W8_9ASPA